jgi:hypothetical protein
VARYLGALLRGQPEHHTGHNPAGALAIVGLLGLGAVIAATGWALFNDVGGKWLEEGHALAANTMLALVGVHVAGVLLASRMHHENLVGAMFTGRKAGRPEEGLRSAWRSVAALMVVAVCAFWWLQWQAAPSAGGSASTSTQVQKAQGHDDRD